MRNIVPTLMIASGVAAMAFVACSSTPAAPPATSGTGGDTTVGGTQTSTSTKAVGTTTTVSATSGSGGGCMGIIPSGDACDDCLTGSCCNELAACNNDSSCTLCLTDNTTMECQTDALLMALGSCQTSKCATACPAPMSMCNPVTNEGCADPTDPAAACDLDPSTMTFQCFSSTASMPNATAVCGTCDNMNGPFCAPLATCAYMPGGNAATECAKYCCTDTDCGAGTCSVAALGVPGVAVGVCIGGGAGGAGGAGAAMDPTCTTPATPPSNGSCFTIPGAGGGGQGGGTQGGGGAGGKGGG